MLVSPNLMPVNSAQNQQSGSRAVCTGNLIDAIRVGKMDKNAVNQSKCLYQSADLFQESGRLLVDFGGFQRYNCPPVSLRCRVG